MSKIFDYIKTRKAWYWLVAAAFACDIAALIIYSAAGRTEFDPNYSSDVFIGLIAGIALGVLSLIFSARLFVFAQYLASLYGFLSYIGSQMNLLGNLVYNVDGSSAPVAFVLIIALSFAATVLALIAGILDRPHGKKIPEGEVKAK